MQLNPIINVQTINLIPFLKIALLIIIFLYAIFTYFVYNKVRALQRIVFFPPRSAGSSLKSVSFIYFLLIVSLFFIALVIV
jgi:hypothetical protein